MKHFTKDELYAEIREYMCAFADCLDRVYFLGAGWGLLGLDSKNYPTDQIEDLKPEDVDINKYYLTAMLDELYEYGINGRRKIDLDWMDFEEAEFFVESISHFRLIEESSLGYSITLSQHVIMMATARWALEKRYGLAVNESEEWSQLGAVLTLSEIALLANMDEKSVRNAANPKHKNHLKTFNHGSRTYVNVGDAKAWLQQRRGFKPTVIIDPAAERDLTKIGFISEQDFGSYLNVQREKKGLALTDAVNAISPSDLTEEKLAGLEQGHFFFDQILFVRLARLYELHTKAFVFAGLALHQKLERDQVEEQMNKHIQS
ncbi:hypothetical protein SAMN05216386_1689 [Nitrosospira briensis]|uniref:Uncharacterized protein n=1 Tax=Nitrosospira briensis TaxID=35799 RepID=A0A1I5BJ37_9PROT|nr:hypothetical protein [Nitrosospira briensis]SFN74599.1 hypothetical protein SAMN05216386_1689 [Nitrosospira briensis]